MFELLQPQDLPPALRRALPAKSIGKLPIRDLLPGQALRVPLDHLDPNQLAKAYATLRVRASRAGSATGGSFSTHRDGTTVYITRAT